MWHLAAVVGLTASVSCAGLGTDLVVKSAPKATVASTTVAPPLPRCVSTLSVEQKVGQMLMPLVENPTGLAPLVAAGQIGGFALIGDPPGEIGALISTLQASSPLPLMVASDEEGGSVQRLKAVLGPLPSAQVQASTDLPDTVIERYRSYSSRMKEMGVGMNFGPVLDIGPGSGIGDRAWGADLATVSTYGKAVIQGTISGGVVPVAKHWPGLGTGQVDPHKGRTQLAGIDELRAADLTVFREAISGGLPAIMVSHGTIPGLTNDVPASISREAITNELRGNQGFTGLVVTDSMGMGAITDTMAEADAIVLAAVAGADLILVSDPSVIPGALVRLVAAVQAGSFPTAQLDASVDRFLEIKGRGATCGPA
jgi:beta-N-acetylhexosaminidase